MNTLYEEKRQLVEKVEKQRGDIVRLASMLANIKMIAFGIGHTGTGSEKIQKIKDLFPK